MQSGGNCPAQFTSLMQPFFEFNDKINVCLVCLSAYKAPVRHQPAASLLVSAVREKWLPAGWQEDTGGRPQTLEG